MRGASRRQVLVDRAGGPLPVGDGFDEVARAEGDVAAREDAGGRGGQGGRFDLDRPGGRQRDGVLGPDEREIGLLPDRQDAGIRRNGDQVPFVVARSEAAVLVEDRDDALELHGLEAVAAEEPVRSAARDEGDAFLLRLLELLVALRRAEHRHLLEALERDDRDLGRAAPQRRARRVERLLHAGALVGFRLEPVDVRLAPQAQRRPGGVEGDEAAADDDDPAAEVHAEPAVHVQEVVDGLDDAVLLDARDLEVAAARHADGEEDRLEPLALQGREAELGRKGCAQLQGDAEREDLVDLGADEGAGKPVLRDAEAHHSARLLGGLEDRDRVTEERQVVRRGEARRTGADDGDLGRVAPAVARESGCTGRWPA